MTKNTIGSLFFLAFSAFYFYSVFGIKKMPGAQFEVMTAQTFPFYVGISGIVISIILLIISFIEKEKIVLSLTYIRSLDLKTTFYFIVLMLFYGFIMKPLGFVIATIIFLTLGFLILKEKNIKKILLISVSVSVGFYLLLNNALGVYIDSGELINSLLGAKS
jgi:putative tricarboxylic transport membrane protein